MPPQTANTPWTIHIYISLLFLSSIYIITYNFISVKRDVNEEGWSNLEYKCRLNWQLVPGLNGVAMSVWELGADPVCAKGSSRGPIDISGKIPVKAQCDLRIHKNLRYRVFWKCRPLRTGRLYHVRRHLSRAKLNSQFSDNLIWIAAIFRQFWLFWIVLIVRIFKIA